jgi:hypothetical protein
MVDIAPQGFKDRAGKPPVYLIPTRPLIELARLYGAGADKVARLSGCSRKEAEHNWLQGISVSECYAAAMRHWWRYFWEGEDYDDPVEQGGTGCHHLAAATFWAFAAMMFTGTQDYEGLHPECDDRPFRASTGSTDGLTPDHKTRLKQLVNKMQWCDECDHPHCHTNYQVYCDLTNLLSD